MRRPWSAPLLAMLAAGCGGTEKVQGVVHDESTGDPLPGAAVKVGDATTTADAAGFYVIEVEELDEGEDVMIIEAYGYERRVVPVDLEDTEGDLYHHRLTPSAPEDEAQD